MNFHNLHLKMEKYQTLVTSLVFEKPETDIVKLNLKTEKTKKLAENIIAIEGDEIFKGLAQTCLDEICSIKPGRKLIKLLSANKNEKITIKMGETNQFLSQSKSIELTFEEDKIKYLSIKNFNKVVSEKTLSAILFHELVHAMHFFDVGEERFEDKVRFKGTLLLKDMHNCEEQHTIVGYLNETSHEKMNVKDVLSENTFLLAKGFFPRISHGEIPEDIFFDISNTPCSLDSLTQYYKWLEAELGSLTVVPDNIIENKTLLMNFLVENPLSILSLDESLQKDVDLLIELMSANLDGVLEVFPDILNDKDFMLKAIPKNPIFLSLICPKELWADKEFVLSLLRSNFSKRRVMDFLSVQLKADPEIANMLLLSNCTK